ncbi:MAG: hypothetical protein AAF960_21145 [Bacteroidota bacterium]
MQRLIFVSICVFSLFSYSFIPTMNPDPRITISSPIEGTEFKGGTTVNVQVDVTCECVMDRMMVTMVNVEAPEGAPPLLTNAISSISGGVSNYSSSVTLPVVKEETDVTLELEVLDKDGDDLESESITITVLP